jgi:hypothetical protein
MEKTEIITGIVQAASANKKGVKVRGMWYNSFKELLFPIKGESITIHFKTVNKDGNTYRNIVEISASSQGQESPKQTEPPKQSHDSSPNAAVKPSLLGLTNREKIDIYVIAADIAIHNGKIENAAVSLEGLNEFAKKIKEFIEGM